MTKARNVTVFFAAGFMAVLAASQASAQAKLEKATVAWGGDGIHNMVADVAIRAGYFKEEGIDLDIANVNSGSLQAAAILGGTADFAPMGFGNAINARERGGDVIVVGTTFDVINMNVVLSNKAIEKAGITDSMSTDEKVKRLKGLRIGISSPGSGSDTLLRSILSARSANPDTTVQIQPLGAGGTLLAALERDATDGFVWMAPTVEVAIAKGAGKIVLDPYKGDIPEIAGVPYIVFATSRKTLAQRPAVIKAALRAMARGMKLIRDEPAKAKVFIRQAFPDVDQAIFDRVVDTAMKGAPRSVVLTHDQVTKTIAWFNSTRTSPLKLTYDDLASDQLARAVSKEILGN